MGTDLAMSTSQEETVLENKVTTADADLTPHLFLEFVGKDDEWKALHTKRLLRKVDIRLLPLLVIMYLLNFLDRNNLSQARLGRLEQDLKMKGTDFNLATSILFVGYILMQLPSNLLLTRVKPSIYLGLAMATWGVVSAAQASVHSFGQLLACRAILGFTEAPFFPGTIMLLSSWYTRSELAHRISWFYCGSSLANMFGGLLGAGVLANLDGAHGIAGWRWLFIIEGSITVGVSLVAALYLPNFPENSMWLSEEERRFAQWRLADDAKEFDNTTTVTIKQGLKLALKDYRLYIFVLLGHVALLTQTFQYFFPSIVNTLGYSNIASLLLTAPVWFVTVIVSLAVTYTSGKTGDRSIHIMCLLLISCIGNIIVVCSMGTGARFFAMFLMPMGAVSAEQIILAWIANSFPRPMVKRSAAIAITNMLGNLANVYGPYIYPATDGPRYLPGGSAVAGLCLVVAGLAFTLRLVHIRENKKLERVENENIAPMSDARGIGFRYII